MTRLLVALFGAASLLVGACGGGDVGRDWGDLPTQNTTVIAGGTELAATDDYRLVLGDSTAASCVQLVVRDVATFCVENSSGVRSLSGRVDDLRVLWLTVSSDDIETVADHFVVWSARNPKGRRIEPVTASGSAHLVWVMQPGEAPWGVQTIAADGTLYTTDSLVGLPGE